MHAPAALELAEMEEGDMRVVDQILVAEAVAAFDETIFVIDGRIILVPEAEIILARNQRWVGFRRIAYPDPDPVFALDYRLGA
jgi:hypothetical protein